MWVETGRPLESGSLTETPSFSFIERPWPRAIRWRTERQYPIPGFYMYVHRCITLPAPPHMHTHTFKNKRDLCTNMFTFSNIQWPLTRKSAQVYPFTKKLANRRSPVMAKNLGPETSEAWGLWATCSAAIPAELPYLQSYRTCRKESSPLHWYLQCMDMWNRQCNLWQPSLPKWINSRMPGSLIRKTFCTISLCFVLFHTCIMCMAYTCIW